MWKSLLGLVMVGLATVVSSCAPVAGNGAAQSGATVMYTTHVRTDGKVDVWFMVTVPPNSGNVYITGNLPEFGPWKPDAFRLGDLDDPTGTERAIRFALPIGETFEYKITQGSWDREAVARNGAILANQRLTVTAETQATEVTVEAWKNPAHAAPTSAAATDIKGTLIYWPDVASAHLDHPRTVSIWLPPGYEANPEKRYRVIYMSDGQNLFDPSLSFTGIDWGIDEAMVAGMEAGRFEPAIVVATTNTPSRTDEYSPWHGAPRYARFLIDELMPRINSTFRTQTGPQNTYHMGSSMGGLLSFYLVRNHPEAFSACGCVSTHFPFSPRNHPSANPLLASNRPMVLDDIARGSTMQRGQRLFFDYGTRGLDARYGPTHAAVGTWLTGQGLVEGTDFKIKEYQGAEHNEAAWRARVGDQLDWLLAPR